MRVELGVVVVTDAALQVLEAAHVHYRQLLERHAAGDWGDAGKEETDANNYAVALGRRRVMSEYVVVESVRVWVLTEADRSSTTIMLPEEY